MWICINMQKIRLFYWFPLEIWLIKKSCNLFGWEQFGPYLRNKPFPKYGICAGILQIISFHYKTNSVKTNDQIFQYIQKTLFLVHFRSISPNFGTQKFFQKIRLSSTTSYGFLAPCPNSEKNDDTIPRKHLDKRMEGQKDGQILFYRTLPANAQGPKRMVHNDHQV